MAFSWAIPYLEPANADTEASPHHGRLECFHGDETFQGYKYQDRLGKSSKM
jgi:hypothetical protein